MRRFAPLVLLAPVCACASLDGLTGGGADDGGQLGGQDAASSRDAAGPHDATGVVLDAPDAAAPSDAPLRVDASACDGGLAACPTGCVDLGSDPNNCGACGNACASGLCGTTLTETMAANPALFTFNGSAQWNSFAPSAELTAAGVLGQAGSVIYQHAIALDAFSATFDFRIGLQGGTRSDGMGFVLIKDGPLAVGGNGGGLGMTGLTGFGVELDIYDNATCGDDSDDHVGVDALTICNAGQGTPTSLAERDVTANVDLGDTHWHTATVTVAGGQATIAIDGTSLLSGATLTGFVPGDAYYLGFTGATGGLVAPDGGGGGYRQEVKNVVVTFSTPRCL